jgi:hypothetical protein
LDPPPLPLQEFKPLQACFSTSFLSELSAAWSTAESDEPDAGAAFKTGHCAAQQAAEGSREHERVLVDLHEIFSFVWILS